VKPSHVLVIPDGNRRYAIQNKLNLEQAYLIAAERIGDVIKWLSLGHGIERVTIYGMSYDNLSKRSDRERKAIENAMIFEFGKWMDDKDISNNINMTVKGDKSVIPEKLLLVANDLERATAKNRGKHVDILIGYSGMRDLLSAIEKKPFQEHLQVKHPVDMLIRTGGRRRLSDCPLLPISYAELFFVEKLFPQIEKEDIDKLMVEYSTIKRNFGK